MNKLKPLIPFVDYCRIFQVIFSVLDGRAITHRSCIFFSVAGAAILRQHYNLRAFPVAGGAVYSVNRNDALVATFGVIEKNQLKSSSKAFHSWIQCEDYALDFMAPIFQENMLSSGFNSKIARRMFQKKLTEMSPNIFLDGFNQEGDFFLAPSEIRTKEIINNFNSKLANSDLANICIHWYRRPPKKIDKILKMQNDLGEITSLKLHSPEVTGVW